MKDFEQKENHTLRVQALRQTPRVFADALPPLPLHFSSAELDSDRYEEGLGIEYYLAKGRSMEAFFELLRRPGRDPSLPLTLHMVGSTTNEEASEGAQHCEMRIMTDGGYSAESLLATAHSVALRNFLQRDVVSACIAFVLQCRFVYENGRLHI